MLLLILASFMVERSLSVLFETKFYIDRYGSDRNRKPLIAILYAVLFVLVIDINFLEVVRTSSNNTAPTGFDWAKGLGPSIHNVYAILIVAIFIAGGSKANLKLFRDVWNIRSLDEASRKANEKGTEKSKILQSHIDNAAAGNEKSKKDMLKMYEDAGLPKAK